MLSESGRSEPIPSSKPEAGRGARARAALIILLVLIFAGAVLRVPFLQDSMPRLLGLCLADDAFYYFQVARNIVNGNGATFDGVHATNGYHPLYMGLLLPIFSIWPEGGEAPVRAAEWLLAVVWLCAAFPIYLLGRELGGVLAGLWAAGFFCLNPYGVVMSGMGVEAPLAVLSLAWASWWYLTRVRSRPESVLRSSAVLGLLLGAAMLSRTDSGLFCVVLGLDLLYSMRKNPKQAAARGLITAGTAALVFAPWLVLSRLYFGHWGQDSGTALMVLTRHEFEASGLSTAAYVWMKLVKSFDENLVRYLGLRRLDYSPFGHYYDLALWGLLGVYALAGRLLRGAAERRPGRGAFLFFGAGAIWMFYAVYFWSQRYWYHCSTMMALALGSGLILAGCSRHLGRARAALPALLAVVCLFFGFGAYRDIQTRGAQPWQEIYYRAAEDLNQGRIAGIPGDAPVGAFNSGIMAYFSGRRIINLDGVVNRDASSAIAEGRFDAYLREQGIDFIIDHADLIVSFGDRCQGSWRGLVVLKKYRDVYVVKIPSEIE